MIIPYHLDDLLEVNENLEVVVENNVVIIDDFYKNFDTYYEMCTNAYVPSWKKENSNSLNFNEYYDCRPIIQNLTPTRNYFNKLTVLGEIIEKVWDEEYLLHLGGDHNITFNYYKNIRKNVSNNMQFHPHIDDAYNVIVYIDKVCSGGTAIYDMPHVENKEHENVLYDITGIDKTIIDAKPNRCVIFHGDQMHGGYIEDHTQYEDNWRINEVTFLYRDLNEPKNRTE